jgi:cytochrome P450
MKFVPERWQLDDPAAGVSKAYADDVREASQPFLVGPRACLGRNFAMMEMGLILTKLIWKFDMELVDPQADFEEQSRCHVLWWKAPIEVHLREANHAGKLK